MRKFFTQNNVITHNTAHQCHPELVSGSQKLRRFRNEFGMTINNSSLALGGRGGKYHPETLTRICNVHSSSRTNSALSYRIQTHTLRHSSVVRFVSQRERAKDEKNLVPACLNALVPIKKKAAFTLAEVLITLGVIGVVAAMTIPTLTTKIREKVAANKLKDTYAILAEAYKLAVAENGPAEGWDIGDRDSQDGGKKLYEIFKPHLKLSQDCATNNGCFYQGTYKALFNNNWAWQPSSHIPYSRCQLMNGVVLGFWSAGSGCEWSSADSNLCGSIWVDINGIDQPNKAGEDFFYFSISDKGIILPNMGNTGTYNTKCKYNDTSNTNGGACTKWVIRKGNFDYLRRDISEEAKNI